MPKRDLPETKSIWLNGKLIPWADAKVHILAHALHYGSAVFEGVRAYKTDSGPAIFRLQEHVDRLFYSAKTLQMEVPHTAEEISKACIQTIADNELESCYIRPIIYYGYGIMGLNPVGAPIDVAVACWPWGAYLPHETVNVKISDYIRIHPNSLVTDAKVSGHYVNSILAVQALKDTNYHEALLLDYNGNVAEGPGENIFMIKDSKIFTPKLGTILAGITRDTVCKIAARANIEVIERDISPEELLLADECFFTGTAAEITPIGSINDTPIGSGGVGEITAQFKKQYEDIVTGNDPDFNEFLTYVREGENT